jgi:Raf kinase inhibitor-like YbhB/YbcL family protein
VAVDRRGPIVLAVTLALSGCGRDAAPPAPEPAASAALVVSSSAFTEGGTIPVEFTCAGAGHRPPLAWSGDAHGASAYAVIVDDPDAPGGDFYHWVVVDLPAGTSSVGDDLPAAARQIKNSGGDADWTPPCPPSGTHHYRFTVYGLSAPTGLDADASLSDAFAAVQQAAVVQGRVVGLVAH